MSDELRQEGRRIAEWLRTMPADARADLARNQRDEAEAEHQEFHAGFREGRCYLCGAELSSFDKEQPCAHWLLKPDEFTKWDFPAVARRFDCFQLQSFLRWVASEDAFAQNINDLPEEGTGKLIECTIRYGACEWSFSCSENDLLGHQGRSDEAGAPHYHFQLRHNELAFIRFNDFHVPLHRNEIRMLEAMRVAPDVIKAEFPGGVGMRDLLEPSTLEQLIGAKGSRSGEDRGLLKIDSIVVADEGTQISGEEIYKLFEKAKAEDVTVASLLPSLENVSVRSIVTPGPDVVEQNPRSQRRKKRSKEG